MFITDPGDPRLDDVRDLNSSDSRPDLPGGKGLVIGEGPLVVGRMLESRFPVRSIVGFAPKLHTFLDTHQVPDDVPVHEVPREVLAQVAGFDMHRGLVAAADRAPALSVDEVIRDASTVAVLEGVGDHENIGSLFRNAAGMGVDAILFGAGCADPLYRRRGSGIHGAMCCGFRSHTSVHHHDVATQPEPAFITLGSTLSHSPPTQVPWTFPPHLSTPSTRPIHGWRCS